ncbi:hypothetical protein CQZ94_19180 [Bacillus sp. MYb209]|uniref:hypothetical protein n=1 Tax=Bacillus sp. MYb209 TaxID=1848605 RepID=UPI000CFB3A24|nr:hypothetical protein [Bacillus sp. MYb209]PQZ53973.1 hypothetical protein CQZ94_19180 [Bacillus sp. MYb209]
MAGSLRAGFFYLTDEKTTHTISTNGYKTEAWFLTEDGIYEVLMTSRKPIAKQWKKEVKGIKDNLVRDIDNYVSVLGQTSKLSSDKFFVETNYTAGTGRKYKN